MSIKWSLTIIICVRGYLKTAFHLGSTTRIGWIIICSDLATGYIADCGIGSWIENITLCYWAWASLSYRLTFLSWFQTRAVRWVLVWAIDVHCSVCSIDYWREVETLLCTTWSQITEYRVECWSCIKTTYLVNNIEWFIV